MRRDPGIDLLRAVAIGGVVLGHWLVTAIVLGADGGLRTASPLDHVPALRPASWLFQTLGLFFFAAGFAAAAARSRRAGAPRRAEALVARIRRLAAPVATLLGSLAVALAAAVLAGVPGATLRTVAMLVVSPLWFLLPLLVLTALTGPLARMHPVPLVAGAVGVVAVADAGLGFLPLTLVAAWLVPYVLGIAVARGRLGGRATGWGLLAGGAVAVVALVLLAGYPDSAVGVPGDARSNLSPPSLACVALALAQCGAALLALPWLRRRGPLATVAAVNARALPIYLWHQVGLVTITVGTLWLSDGRALPGLHTVPDGSWLAVRAMCVAVCAALLVVAFRATGTSTAGSARPRSVPAAARSPRTSG